MSVPQDAGVSAWLVRPDAAATAEVWGLTPEERLRRALARIGCLRVERVRAGEAPRAPASGRALVFRADWVFDERLVAGLAGAGDALLVAPGGEPVAAHVEAAQLPETAALLAGGARGEPSGLRRVAPGDLVEAWSAALRKSEPPYVLPARPEQARQIEDRLFSASYKGVTDLVTKWVWPRPATAATRWLAHAHVHPNAVTLASWLLAAAAAWLFFVGAFGAGLVAAWAMTFLDTVDGKLARVTLTSSRVGHALDHGLDIVHPPFWYLAWGLGLGAGFEVATAVVVGGYVVGRLLEGVFLLVFRMETHAWRPVDALFRTITARRNPNLILLSVGTLGGRPDLGLAMVAIWTVVSLGFHALRLAQALAVRARGGRVAPFDEARRDAARPMREVRSDGRSPA